jgi:hypothetical protein
VGKLVILILSLSPFRDSSKKMKAADPKANLDLICDGAVGLKKNKAHCTKDT